MSNKTILKIFKIINYNGDPELWVNIHDLFTNPPSDMTNSQKEKFESFRYLLNEYIEEQSCLIKK